MNLIKAKWTKKDYTEFLNYLYSFEDKKYKDFHSKLTYNTNNIGIKVPILKDISKSISKGNFMSFIEHVTNNTYEEWLIFGLIIGYAKIDFKNKLNLLDRYITNIDNWSSCDTICANMKDFEKNKEIGYEYILKLIKKEDIWSVRVGVVLLLDFYINDEYLEQIFKICDSIIMDEYYVKMAISWLISSCYIKYPELTLKYLNNNKLDNFTYNKAIQKIIESTRVSKLEKDFLRKTKK